MADRAGERVRRVVGPGVVIEMQQVAHHVDDLALVRGARAHHGLLDLHGRVLAHLDAGERHRHQRRAARVRGRDGGAHVSPEIDALACRLLGAVALHDGREVVRDVPEADGEVAPGGGLDAAVGAAADLAAALLDDAPAGVREAGVDTKDDHAPSPPDESRTSVLNYTIPEARGRGERRRGTGRTGTAGGKGGRFGGAGTPDAPSRRR